MLWLDCHRCNPTCQRTRTVAFNLAHQREPKAIIQKQKAKLNTLCVCMALRLCTELVSASCSASNRTVVSRLVNEADCDECRNTSCRLCKHVQLSGTAGEANGGWLFVCSCPRARQRHGAHLEANLDAHGDVREGVRRHHQHEL